MDWENFIEIVEDKTTQLHGAVASFKTDMLEKIEAAKDNEILTAIRGLSARLDAIEAHFADPGAE